MLAHTLGLPLARAVLSVQRGLDSKTKRSIHAHRSHTAKSLSSATAAHRSSSSPITSGKMADPPGNLATLIRPPRQLARNDVESPSYHSSSNVPTRSVRSREVRLNPADECPCFFTVDA